MLPCEIGCFIACLLVVLTAVPASATPTFHPFAETLISFNNVRQQQVSRSVIWNNFFKFRKSSPKQIA